MQKLPYVVVTNPRLSLVYELYYKSFESFRRVQKINTLEENDTFCKAINESLKEHLAVIPNLVTGVLECEDHVRPDVMDDFVNTMLRAVGRPIFLTLFDITDLCIPAHLPASDSRPTPRTYGDLQLGLAYPATQL